MKPNDAVVGKDKNKRNSKYNYNYLIQMKNYRDSGITNYLQMFNNDGHFGKENWNKWIEHGKDGKDGTELSECESFARKITPVLKSGLVTSVMCDNVLCCDDNNNDDGNHNNGKYKTRVAKNAEFCLDAGSSSENWIKRLDTYTSSDTIFHVVLLKDITTNTVLDSNLAKFMSTVTLRSRDDISTLETINFVNQIRYIASQSDPSNAKHLRINPPANNGNRDEKCKLYYPPRHIHNDNTTVDFFDLNNVGYLSSFSAYINNNKDFPALLFNIAKYSVQNAVNTTKVGSGDVTDEDDDLLTKINQISKKLKYLSRGKDDKWEAKGGGGTADELDDATKLSEYLNYNGWNPSKDKGVLHDKNFLTYLIGIVDLFT
jgi:hypothetical protein